MREYAAIWLGIALAFTIVSTKDGRTDGSATQPTHILHMAASADEFDPAFPVVPTWELEDWMRAYERCPATDPPSPELKQAASQWAELKRSGKTLWNSQAWMKEPGYYKKLGTRRLAQECFGRPIIALELSVFREDPRLGLERVRIMHDGFAELFSRPDLWEGILGVLEQASATVADPNSGLERTLLAAGSIEAICTLCRLSPLREQTKAHEALFLKAQLQVLKQFRARLESPRADRSIGFFGEPCWVANMSLVFLKQLAPKEYEAVIPKIRRVRFPRQQDPQDLRSYLDMLIADLEATRTVTLAPASSRSHTTPDPSDSAGSRRRSQR